MCCTCTAYSVRSFFEEAVADRFVVSVSAFVSTTLFRRSCRQRCSCSSTDPVRQRITTLFLSRLIPTSPLHLVSSARTYAGRRAMQLEGVSGGTARACQETLQDDLPGGDALVLGLIAVMVLERCGRPTEWSVVWRPSEPRLGLARRSERATKWAYKCACPARNVLDRSIDIAEACLESERGRRVWSEECVDATLHSSTTRVALSAPRGRGESNEGSVVGRRCSTQDPQCCRRGC